MSRVGASLGRLMAGLAVVLAVLGLPALTTTACAYVAAERPARLHGYDTSLNNASARVGGAWSSATGDTSSGDFRTVLYSVAPASPPLATEAGGGARPQVALDSSSARALTSADQSVGRRLSTQLDGCDLVMCRTAANEYQSAVARLAGPQEKAAADALMQRVTIVPDNPSARVANLTLTRRVGANGIQIFGTADRMGIPIATSDLSSLRGAHARGVTLDAIVHPSVSFRGL